jgi:Major Facilitator Superfamily
VTAAAGETTPRTVQNRAIVANAGIVLLSVATGGLGADLLQLYAAQVLALTPRQVGLTLGLLVLSVPAQLLAASRARRHTPRQMMRWGYAAILGCLGVFPLVRPVLTVNRAAGFALFIAVVLAVEVAISCSWAIIWWAWMQDLVRPPERGRFLGRMRMITQSVSAVALLSVSLLFHSRVSYAGYNLLLGGLAAWVLLALWQFGRIPDKPRPDPAAGHGQSQERRRRFTSDLADLFRHRGVRRLIAVMLAMQLLTAPLLSTYLLDVIRLSPGMISRLIAVRTIVAVLALRRWGKITDKYGAKRVQVAAGLAVGCTSLLWLAVRPPSAGHLLATLLSWPLVLLITVLNAIAMSGLSLAFLVDMQDVVPPEHASAAFAVQDVITSSLAQLAFALAGVLIAAGRCGPGACTPAAIDPYRVLLVLALPAALVIAYQQWRGYRASDDADAQAPGHAQAHGQPPGHAQPSSQAQDHAQAEAAIVAARGTDPATGSMTESMTE